MAEVVTLTMNPALDLSTQVERLEPAHKLRCEQPLWHPGGGGINVARVLHRLGVGVLALFPAGGGTGQRLCRLLQDEGVPMQCLPIDQETRENFQVTERASGREYRFVLPGPALGEAQWQQALQALEAVRPRPACVVASGGLAPGMPADFLARVVRWARGAGVRVALDCWGEPLQLAMAEGVWVVKPSLRELEEFMGRPLQGEASQVAAARELVASGKAQVVALSLGESGALLATAAGVWIAPALRVQVAGTVGAGDSFMAGLLSSLLRSDDPEAALRMAMAAAGSALTAAGTALSDPGQVATLVEQVRLRKP